MFLKTSFEPIADQHTRVLILGSLPGDRSIELGEYYGHARNRFWKVLAMITEESTPASYEEKKAFLLRNQLGVWDVARQAIRKGSLDSAIVDEVPNDIPAFIAQHPNLRAIAFNGLKSEALFNKYFHREERLQYFSLPSTSPANAGIGLDALCEKWRVIRHCICIFPQKERHDMKIKRVQQVLGPMPIGDPFILGVHHRDEYPRGNGQLGPDPELLKDKKLGSDFDNQAKWRMYHGQRIPGFPYHPHRGFEIVTIVEEGFADHFDSRGSKGRYGNGDVQLMSAGKGVLHGEMFPLLNEEQENPFRLFQIWVNLPAKHKLTEPDYKMLWNERIPRHTLKQEQGDVRLKIILGEYEGVKALEPLKNSWAQDPAHHMGIVLVDMDPNTLFTLPAVSNTLHRYLLVYEGQGDLQIDGQRLIKNDFAELSGAEEIQIQNGTQDSQLIVLEGEPIGEPVAAHGPFVMNTQQELQLAFQEFRQTQFGGWPWGDQETDAVHPKDAGRFASYEFGEVVDKP